LVELDLPRVRVELERKREREVNSNILVQLAILEFGELSEFQGGFEEGFKLMPYSS